MTSLFKTGYPPIFWISITNGSNILKSGDGINFSLFVISISKYSPSQVWLRVTIVLFSILKQLQSIHAKFIGTLTDVAIDREIC